MQGRLAISGVNADTPLILAAPAILRARVSALLELEAACEDGVEADLVHDLRVASRRLREALRLLAPAYADGGLRRWRRRVRDLTRAFGPVRDADVFVDALSQVLPGLDAGGQRAAAFLAGYALGQRERDLGRLVAELSELGLLADRARLERDIDRVGSGAITGEPLAAIARDAITDRLKTVRATWAPLARESDLTQYHRLRIAFKELRYAAEVFAPCYDETFGPLYDTLRGFQDSLGEMHDLQVFAEVIAEQQSDGSAAAIGVRRKELDTVLAALTPVGAAAAERFVELSAAYPVDTLSAALLDPLGGDGQVRASR